MKTTLKTLLAAAGLTIAATTGVVAEDRQKAMEHKFEKAATYYGECEATKSDDFAKIQPQMRAFTDMEVMAKTMNDPEKFFKLMSTLNDPRTIHVMTSCATEPVMWDTWMRGATDINKMGDAMIAMMHPEGMVKWMMAPVNAKVWQSMLEHMDPDKYVRWAQASVNPRFYDPVVNMFDLSWYEPRINWFLDTDSYEPVVSLFSSAFSYFETAEKKPETAEQPKEKEQS